MRFTKRPASVEAVQFCENTQEDAQRVAKWVSDGGGFSEARCRGEGNMPVWYVTVVCPSATFKAYQGDWIIRDEHDQHMVCPAIIFEKTYEAALV